jgi:RHS repeat-associated protein
MVVDDAGNRTKMKYFDGSTTTTTTYHYNDLNQMYHRSPGLDWNYTYDENGNLTKDDLEGGSKREFTWNEDNRLTYVDNVADDDEVEYTYDPMGRRIMRYDVDNNTYTCYYYDGLTVIAERKKIGAGSWSYSSYYTTTPGVIGNVLFRSNPEAHFHYDALGNVVFISLSDSTPLSYFEQEAYGNVKVGSQSGYHLTTKEYDSIPELYYFWQRWYDPLLGRFLSTAPYPIHLEHPYIFNRQNPEMYIDPIGEFYAALVCGSEAAKRGPHRGGCRNFADCNCRGQNSPIQQCLDSLGIASIGCRVIHYQGTFHDACMISCPGMSCTVEKPGWFPPINRCWMGIVPPPPILP